MSKTHANLIAALQRLGEEVEGSIQVDSLTRVLYSTDASAYQEMPLAVAIPKTETDIQ